MLSLKLWPECQPTTPSTFLSQFHFLYHLIFTLFISSQRYLQGGLSWKSCYIVHKLQILLSLPSVDGEGTPAQVKATYFLLLALETSVMSSLLPDLQNCSYLSQCKYDKGFSIQSEKALISVLTWPPSIVIIQSSAIQGAVCPMLSFIQPWLNLLGSNFCHQHFLPALFVKSTMTFLMHYLMNYFLSLPKLLLEFWNLK